MKRFIAAIVIALIMVGAVAVPTPQETMYNNCVDVMKKGACVALSDPGSFTEEQLNTPVFLGKGVKATWRDFLAVRGIGSVSPTDFRMCDVAKQYCDANIEDNRCKVGLALWGS